MSSIQQLGRITQADAENEPLADRLSFEKRTPSPETAAALARASSPQLPASDMQQLKALRRPGSAS
jgi:hypothetical protein